MIEIPTKNAAAYTGIFHKLGEFATRHNDQAGVDEDPHPDQIELKAVSRALYASGDAVTLKALLSHGQIQSLRVEIKATEREPFQASLCLEKTEIGLAGSESMHDHHGLRERKFTITGDQVTVQSENQANQPYHLGNQQEKQRMTEELGYLTDGLPYLLGPGFQA